ncbi:hypothetical protein B0H17DRAFT_1216894 [Mycena rosella]|uniref:Uncharacterized protein n=1 Tax=Mycena rosella TaxID=1033263 RepID=A0AAD7C3G8_MYCRO|nr:hypothetical protein B0H17DRAFT_1216894 [Mycena rosella]
MPLTTRITLGIDLEMAWATILGAERGGHLLVRTPAPHVFTPLGNEVYFHNLAVPPPMCTHCLVWWDML